SPLLFGHKLWEETRIAVFEQTVNNINIHPGAWQEQHRVAFGRGWIKDGAIGLLKDTCELFYPILPLLTSRIDNKDNNVFNNINKNKIININNIGPILSNIT